MKNEMKLEVSARSVNEGLARVAVAAFMTGLDPTLEEVEDVKTAVSEAVTNSIIHGYGVCDADAVGEEEETDRSDVQAKDRQKIYIICSIRGCTLYVEVKDYGVGIEDIEKAMEPLYTTKPELERSGMGFAFMEAFMDELMVESRPGEGTSVKMKKIIQSNAAMSEPV